MNRLKSQQPLAVLLFLFIATSCMSPAAAEAALACYGCHGSQSTLDIRPVDDSYRNISTGGLPGNHRTHLDVSATQSGCAKCHPGSDRYTSSHRDGKIRISSAINGAPSPVVTTYRGYTSPWPQTPPLPPGKCDSVNCHFEGLTPTWGTSSSLTKCDTCHGAPPNDGSHRGKHQRYFGNYTSSCLRCHPNHLVEQAPFAHATSAGKRPLGVQFITAPNSGGTYSGTISYPDYLPSQHPARSGTCNTIYCHSNGAPFDKSNVYAAPTWGGTVTCSSCHDGAGAGTGLSGRHGKHTATGVGYSFACEKCHVATASGSDTIVDPTRHVNQVKDLSFKDGGSYDINGTKGCTSTYCHSDGNKDPLTGKTGAPTIQAVWSDSSNAGSTPCFYCHKGRLEDNTQANCIRIGGSWDSAKGLCSPEITMASNAHHLLVGPQWIRKYPCSYCHYATVDHNNTMGNISSMAKHINGKPDIVIDPKWNIVGRANPTYNPVTKVCDNLYCHSDGTTDPDTIKPFAWPEKNAKCNSCHGHPIGSCSADGCHDGKLHSATATTPAKIWPVVTGWEPGKEWMGALPMFPNQGAGSARANSHPRHVQSDYACDECHASTIKGSGGCSSCHAAGIPAGSMSEVSHLDGTFHVNKVKDVVFKRGGTYNNDKSCSNTACHKDGADPVWGGSVGTQVICKNCHGSSGADIDTSITTGGNNAKINLAEWASTGHGRYSSSGPYPVSKNPPAKFPGDNACWYCHDNSVYHNDPNNVFRLRMHSQFSRRFEGECVYCHMTRSQSECVGCHNNSESLAPQLANITSSHAASAKWPDGTHVIRPDHTGMGSTSCMTDQDQANPCHSSDQRTHNSGAGVWTEEQKDDVKNQYMMMGVCLQCHDDDSNNKCTSCHDYINNPGKFPPAKYALGFNGGSGMVIPKKARASSVHFGYKHYKDFINTGGWTKDANGKYLGVWKGGKFCWDCHDPHGDSNIYMIHDNVATSTDGKFGIPYTRAAVSFKKAQSGTDYARIAAPYNGICNVCHSPESKHYRADGGDGHNSGTRCTTCHEHRFSDSHADNQACNACHQNKPIPRHSAFGQPRDCVKCHAQTIGKRTDVMNTQFAGSSHHIQGVNITSRQCYACHWEATPEGLIDVRYHKGYNYLNYSSTPNSQVDLVVWGPGIRPTTYKLYSTAIQFLASNVSFGIISTERKEVAKVTNHCISCHSDQNNNTQPFNDCKTPRQYAWDKQSIAARYSQKGTTPWGKYATNGKNSLSKAYSAHGNATANQGGYNTSSGIDSPIGNTRGGTYNVQCFDCHNSHGSRVVGTTSSYTTFDGTRNGANLKETQAGKGGYKYNYKAKANVADTVNPYSAGGGQCFDCHMNAAQNASISGVEQYKTPWGYQGTFGAVASIKGYMDTPGFGQASTAYMARYKYKGMAMQGGHLKRSGYPAQLNYTTAATNKINGLCTPCHDPHGVTPTLGSRQPYGVPLLKGTWMTSPYKEDVADPDPTAAQYHTPIPGVWTDQKTFGSGNWINEDATKFAGLCLRCHYQQNLTNGTDHTWKLQNRIHESVKGWKTANGTIMHQYACSKCHAPHVSAMPRLMITNCLDYKHKGQVATQLYPTIWGSGGGTNGSGSGSFPKGYGNPANASGKCHPDSGVWQNNYWNVKTPW